MDLVALLTSRERNSLTHCSISKETIEQSVGMDSCVPQSGYGRIRSAKGAMRVVTDERNFRKLRGLGSITSSTETGL